MEDKSGIVIYISPEFDLKIRQYLLDLEKEGVKKTKSVLLSELAEQALLSRITRREVK